MKVGTYREYSIDGVSVHMMSEAEKDAALVNLMKMHLNLKDWFDRCVPADFERVCQGKGLPRQGRDLRTEGQIGGLS